MLWFSTVDFLKTYFIYFSLCWVFIAVWAFLQLQAVGAALPVAWASHCSGFSCSALGCLGSRCCRPWAPEHRLGSCGTPAQLLQACGIFSAQRQNPCLLHWRVDSLPLSHQGDPVQLIFNLMIKSFSLASIFCILTALYGVFYFSIWLPVFIQNSQSFFKVYMLHLKKSCTQFQLTQASSQWFKPKKMPIFHEQEFEVYKKFGLVVKSDIQKGVILVLIFLNKDSSGKMIGLTGVCYLFGGFFFSINILKIDICLINFSSLISFLLLSVLTL